MKTSPAFTLAGKAEADLNSLLDRQAVHFDACKVIKGLRMIRNNYQQNICLLGINGTHHDILVIIFQNYFHSLASVC